MNPIPITLTKQQIELLELCLDRGKQAVEISSQGQMTNDLRQLFDSTKEALEKAVWDCGFKAAIKEQLSVHK